MMEQAVIRISLKMCNLSNHVNNNNNSSRVIRNKDSSREFRGHLDSQPDHHSSNNINSRSRQNLRNSRDLLDLQPDRHSNSRNRKILSKDFNPSNSRELKGMGLLKDKASNSRSRKVRLASPPNLCSKRNLGRLKFNHHRNLQDSQLGANQHHQGDNRLQHGDSQKAQLKSKQNLLSRSSNSSHRLVQLLSRLHRFRNNSSNDRQRIQLPIHLELLTM